MELSALVGNPSRRGKLQTKTCFIPFSSHHHRVIIILSLSWSHKSSLSYSFYNHIFVASHRHESGNAREATDKYRGNYKPSVDIKTKILCIFVFLSGCCFIALLHSCFPHVWLFVTSCTFTFLSCICYFAFPLFCCVIIVLHFTFKCFIYVFHCLLFIFMWFFFIR